MCSSSELRTPQSRGKRPPPPPDPINKRVFESLSRSGSFPKENFLIFLLEIQPNLTGFPARGSLTVRVALSQNNRVKVKINCLVDLRDVKFVKEKRIIQSDERKSLNNRVNIKINCLVDLRDLKFVKEKELYRMMHGKLSILGII